ncbi:aspartyl protease-like protein [Thioalkalivibrio nitratireducens DSM 14787]|uniref:Aspartyl protease-like protein n=1 Tax=Thioalkalivibrio nitratireducens (strain DSM 14787 / UNIQEM 213 / ALEN2) TaxID=1255043 RepID=L0DY22_THIND|nr:TIGR02281 family clan AA aspartic protease [Thioalkalivibrio nitratireducens]AGA33892.1 aspartyl protease-like protein [Thioalkalivibrio nitratireducens DSM 14787]
MQRFQQIVVLVAALGFTWVAGPAMAELRVQALFAGKALFLLDGQRFVLSDGETGPDGLRLLRATSESALVEYQGREQRLGLERGRFAGAYESRSLPELRLLPNSQFGGYRVNGTINGQPVGFVVDTGATLITLSQHDAERLRLSLSGGNPVPVETASGRVMGQRVVLERVQIGGLEERDVGAVVLPGDRPATALLGMSFLSRLDIRNEGPTLVLQAR